MTDFPNKPITLYTFDPKGGVDMVARLIAQGISAPLGQPVTVINGPELSSVERVAKAPPDGHTLLYFGPSIWTAPVLQKTSYDPAVDFAPITLSISQPNILVVHPKVPANSVAELIALAQARPGQLKYASGINGASSQLAGELFTALAGVDIVGVPYANTAQLAVADLIAGKVDMMIFSAGSGMEHVRAGRLKALAVTSAQPSRVVPGLPPIAATVLGYESVHTQGVFAPAATPKPVIERLNKTMVEFLHTAAATGKISEAGMEVVASTPQALAAQGKAEMKRCEQILTQRK